MAIKFFDSTFRTFPLEISKHGYSSNRLQHLYDELVERHTNDGSIAVLTLALTLPSDGVERCPHEVTKAFEKSLRDELRWSNNFRSNSDTNYFDNKVRFVWAYKVTGEPCSRLRVWRVAVVLDSEIFYGMSGATEQFKVLMQMSWCRALDLTVFNPKLLVKFGRKPVALISKRSSTCFNELAYTFQRLSILAELPKKSSRKTARRSSTRA